MYPRRSPTTHTEQLGDEVSVYVRMRVHALNPTAARVWRQCDGVTSPETIAAVLRVEMGIPEAEVVVDLTLTQLARVHPGVAGADSLFPSVGPAVAVVRSRPVDWGETTPRAPPTMVRAGPPAPAAAQVDTSIWAPRVVAVGRHWMRPGSRTRKVTTLATAR